MGKRRYSLEEKIRFLDLYKEKGSIATSAAAVGVRANTAWVWVQHEQKLREEYAQSKEPVDITAFDDPHRYKMLPLDEKIRCIMVIEAGLPLSQAAEEFEVSLSSVQRWYKAKDGLLALYYSQKDNGKQEKTKETIGLSSSTNILEEVWMDKEQIDKELTATIKAQAKEIEYLKDRVTFLESLNEILKERSGPSKKKKNSRQSLEVSLEEDET